MSGAPRPKAPRRPRVAAWRGALGWIVLAIGVAGIFLPLLPALILIPAGVALLGRRARAVAWLRAHVKLHLRKAQRWRGVAGRVGRFLREKERRAAKVLRDRRLGPWERPRRV